jgi:hypothetical protein
LNRSLSNPAPSPTGVSRGTREAPFGGACLSKGHIATPQTNNIPGVVCHKGSSFASIRREAHWRDLPWSAREIIESADSLTDEEEEDLFEFAEREEEERAKRGKVREFTAASRRRFMIDLSKVRNDADVWTMALTCPGVDPGPESFYEAARCFNRWFAVRWKSIGVHWKKEPQKRGALHSHLLLYLPAGFTPEHGAVLHESIAAKWNALIGGDDEEGRASHLWWHLRPENWQPVRSMKGYLAKYLGKVPESEGAVNFGHFWGRINVEAIPYGEKVEFVPPAEVLGKAYRDALRLRQRKAELGKTAALNRALLSPVLESGKAVSVTSGKVPNARMSLCQPVPRWVHLFWRDQAAAKGFKLTPPKLPKKGAVNLLFADSLGVLNRILMNAAVNVGLIPTPPSGFRAWSMSLPTMPAEQKGPPGQRDIDEGPNVARCCSFTPPEAGTLQPRSSTRPPARRGSRPLNSLTSENNKTV